MTFEEYLDANFPHLPAPTGSVRGRSVQDDLIRQLKRTGELPYPQDAYLAILQARVFPNRSKGEIIKQVIKDLTARKAVGLRKYGRLLYPNDGRITALDNYQEVLDSMNYSHKKDMESC